MKCLLLVSVWVAAPFFATHAQDVDVLALICTPTPVGPRVEGELKNVSSKPLSRVHIAATFRDADGRLVSTVPGAITFNPILPGQTSPFRFYGDRNPAITQVTVVPYVNTPLAASGETRASCPAR